MKVRDLGQNPISQDKPAGDDAHYEPEFEELQQEIDKLSIASASGEGTDWKKVASLSVTILSEKSKDLLVAVYLATALTRLHGFEGFGAAVAMLNDLVNNFWETMYPVKRRIRGRLNAIAWWQERMESFAKGLRDSPPLPAEQVENAKKALDALDQSLREKVEDAPSMRELVNYVNLLPVQQPEPEAAPEPAPAPAQPVSAQPDKAQPEAKPMPQPTPRAQPAPTPQPAPDARTAHTSPPPAQATDKKEAAQALSTLLDQLLGLAEFHFQDAPTNPLSYRLRRLWAWLPLAAPPPAEIGQTRIPPPDSIVKPSIEQLLAAGNHEAALRAAESRVTEHRFWLDISRFSATALENLGPSYKSAHAAVCAETLLLLERLQGLENLGFSDGTPFADPETQAWLKSLSLGDNATQTGGDPVASAVDQALSQARGLLKDKRPLDAVDLVQQGLESAASGKARLLWRLALGRLLLLAGKPDLAAPLNEKNLADMDAHDLEVFDPDLALQILLLVHETCRAVNNEESNSLEKQILARIVRLDPGQAMRIVGLR